MPTVSVIAHRGASAYAPEHSFEAYELALAMGASAIELDVRTIGGELVVQHDRTRARVAREPLPLHDVLARYGRATRYWIELKDPSAAGETALTRAIARHRLRDRVTIQAFDRSSLRRIGRLDRELPRVALLRESVPAARVRRRIALAGRGVRGVGPCVEAVDARVVEAARARGMSVQPYTVNDPAEMERLVRLGVDGIFTDVPDVLSDVVASVRPGSSGTSRWCGCRPPARAGGSACRTARTGGRSSRTP
ncbi:MAG TPA: glycerophosphodiester phosphodiesterase family protein [Thermoleophilaceae bacterium]|jgi:glycerophosphoryl diester phosphodiesterase